MFIVFVCKFNFTKRVQSIFPRNFEQFQTYSECEKKQLRTICVSQPVDWLIILSDAMSDRNYKHSQSEFYNNELEMVNSIVSIR